MSESNCICRHCGALVEHEGDLCRDHDLYTPVQLPGKNNWNDPWYVQLGFPFSEPCIIAGPFAFHSTAAGWHSVMNRPPPWD